MTRGDPPELSVVVVNYRSAEESRRCVQSLRDAFASEGIPGEVILVDCGSGPEEARILASIPADRLVLLADNRGYSGGINAGLSSARGARLVLSNADVVYHPGALTTLLREIADPAVGAAGPLAFWDEESRLRLPVGFRPGFWRDLAQRLPGRWPKLDARRFRAHALQTARLWERGGRAPHLSGAVLAVRREVLDRVGRFDERFPFEYEETEWEERVRRAGLELRFVPAARVRHLWARSSSRSPETAARRAASERLYRERRYGRVGRVLLERLPPPPSIAAARLSEPSVSAAPGAELAISPLPSRIPFAGADLTRDFRLPDSVAGGLPPGPLYFTIYRSADGEPLSTAIWEKTA